MQKTIEVLGVDLVVDFDGEPFSPACWDHDAEGGEPTINAIHLDGTEVTELLNDYVINQIMEDLTIWLCRDAQAEAEAEKAEYLAEMRRDEALCE